MLPKRSNKLIHPSKSIPPANPLLFYRRINNDQPSRTVTIEFRNDVANRLAAEPQPATAPTEPARQFIPVEARDLEPTCAVHGWLASTARSRCLSLT
jgi:hypothetical protein